MSLRAHNAESFLLSKGLNEGQNRVSEVQASALDPGLREEAFFVGFAAEVFRSTIAPD